jgi:hypothetical protein
MKSVHQNGLHKVLAELGDKAACFGRGLQHVNGRVQIEFARLPQERAGLGPGYEYRKRIDADLLVADRGSHGAPRMIAARATTLSATHPSRAQQ